MEDGLLALPFNTTFNPNIKLFLDNILKGDDGVLVLFV